MPGVSAVFVLPVIESGRGAPVASLLSAAGWAAAGARRYGRSWIVTPRGLVDPTEARRLAVTDDRPTTRPGTPISRRDRVVGAVPAGVKTFGKDARHAVRGRRFEIGHGPWRDGTVELVWQRHELFQVAGLDLADRLGVPSVLFVPATKVWEAARWGTRRPGWGGLVERLGESPALRRAELVACGTDQVAEQVARLGVPADRLLVTPNGVDLDRFAVAERDEGRRRAGLTDDRVVVGWVGSFRPFHDLDQLVDACAGIDGIHLLLVGDGAERPAVEARCRDLGVEATFTGTVGPDVLPHLLAAMDIAVVVTGSADTFHYSPLKLGEYLAAGRPVVAPAVPSISERVRDDREAVLVPPGDRDALRAAIQDLRDDPGRRQALGRAGRVAARRSFSWDQQLRRIDEHLGHHPSGRPYPPGDTTTNVPPSRD